MLPIEGLHELTWRTSYLEKVIAGHARLPGHSGGDDDDIGSLQGLTQLVLSSIALNAVCSRLSVP